MVSPFQLTKPFVIFLKRIAFHCRYQDMVPQFARSVPHLCMISNHIMNLLFTQWGHLLTNLNQGWLDILHLEMFAAAIHAIGAPL